jgi:pimeloyl-ACP methyl ester carboxylesterase
MHELMTTDLRAELGAITAPTLVVYAYDTTYGVPESTIDAIFRSAYTNLKAAQFVRVNDTYHFIMYDQPDRFAEALTAFIGGQ